MFQKTVQRQFTVGFPGEIINDGMLRAFPGRIVSDSLKNVITRAFGFAGETGTPTDDMVGQSLPVNPQHPTGEKYTIGRAGEVPEVTVGGAVFFGILGHPKHYALLGTPDGSLEPSLALPKGTEGEFIQATSGMVVDIFNAGTTDIAMTYGMAVGFMKAGTSAADNPQSVPDGGLVAVTDITSLPKGVQLIPTAQIMTVATLVKSAAGKPNAMTIKIKLTQ